MIFRATWVKILKEGIYRVADEDKHHGHVRGYTLSRPSALYVKGEKDTRRNHLNTVRDVLVERERTPSAQLRQTLVVLKENVDTQVQLSPFPACHRANRAKTLLGVLPENLFRRRSSNSVAFWQCDRCS